MMTIDDFQIGDQVLFGRGHGEKTLGEVVRKGRKNLKVKQLEARGSQRTYSVGTIWTVPPSLCTKADNMKPLSKAPGPPKHAGFKVGDKVTFNAKGQVVTGYVKRVNRKTISVQPSNGGERYWRVSPSILRDA